MNQPSVQVQQLSRRFDSVDAVCDLTFDIARGQVLGFIGANGAGKSTTMRILATIDQPTAGTARVCGYDVTEQPHEVRRRIGWMPDSYGTYPHTTVTEYLDFFARAVGLRGAQRQQAVSDVLDFTDLRPLHDRMIDKLSKGMGQRLCLGRALLHDPEVLILDEPAAGLDPQRRVEFKRLVRLLANDGKTIFISSHILSELEEMCDAVLFIDDGRVVHHGSAESLKTDTSVAGVVYEIALAGDPEPLLRWAEMNPGMEIVERVRHGARVRLASIEPLFIADVLRRMLRDEILIIDFHRVERRLEQAFIDTLERSHARDH